MSNIKNKINFFENLLDKNKSQSLKNTSVTNNTNNVKKKITHWNKIRKKVLTETDINNNDSLNKNTTINTNTNTNINNNTNINTNTDRHNDDDDETLFNENSIIN